MPKKLLIPILGAAVIGGAVASVGLTALAAGGSAAGTTALSYRRSRSLSPPPRSFYLQAARSACYTCRMALEWNRVTWYSKLLAVLLFLATFAVAFALGREYGLLEATPSASVGASLPAGQGSPESGAPGAASSSPAAPGPGMRTLTEDDLGATIALSPGERFALALGSGLSWSVSFKPEGVVVRVPGADPAPGTQGFFEAAASGTTTLSASGRPICSPGAACPQFIELFQATIAVR
ncbi:MAG TPA: hypothetical protein VHC68_01240 [Candidatus Paceibacterota bacterium]|nr:hypothetical protein [Candidatus Paceibacterota bacterium]